MLKSIDVLLGLTVVMLALSMAVTAVTQFFTTALGSRGRHLKEGLAGLLRQIDPALRGQIADAVANAVLAHPLIRGARGRLGAVVQREEFTTLLLDLATDEGDLEAKARHALKKALSANGIADPEDTLKRIRAAALQLETADPKMTADVRQAIAIVRQAESELVAKIHAWFDQTMDRVSSRFTAYAHAITFAVALVVAVGLQVDTVGLVNRFSADAALREAFVAQAGGMQPGDATQTYSAFLTKYGVISVARTPAEWLGRWGDISPFGVLVTALLISLGAPFWYKAVANLLNLRSALAAKDDAARKARGAGETPRQGAGAAPADTRPPADFEITG